jgi:site-specific DNA recombinase
MTRVALYARYSSDNQSVASIEDQFRICREHAAREQWKVIGTYHDAAISGASVILRPGVQTLLQDAQRGKFDVVLAEALDRVSRDQADVATLFKHLRFAGVQIVTLSEGEISELHVGLKGTMNALFLKDLAAKTHRGSRGRVEKGRSGGGLCYGYDVVKHTDAEGEPIRGERTINEAEANIIRRVFLDFAAGISPRAIARRLNDEGVPGPDGALWTDSTLRGHTARAAPASSTTNSISASWSGIASAISKIRRPGSASRASTRVRSGSRPTFPSFALSMRRCGRTRRPARASLQSSMPTSSPRPALLTQTA